jgi:hypothetical protein
MKGLPIVQWKQLPGVICAGNRNLTHMSGDQDMLSVVSTASALNVTNAPVYLKLAWQARLPACHAPARQARLEWLYWSTSTRRSTAPSRSATTALPAPHAPHPHLTKATKPQPRTRPATCIPITPQAHAYEHAALVAPHAMRWHGRSTD